MSDDNTFLGIDIAKATFDVALQTGSQRYESHFSNDADGFAHLRFWLEERAAGQVHACLEATGRYGDLLAAELHQAGHCVSVINPARIKAYGQSKLQRGKNDRLDARLIADFCRTQSPPLWQPPTTQQRELREMVRRLADLQQMQQQEMNRLKAGQTSTLVLADLQAALVALQQRIKALSKAIKGHLRTHPQLNHAYDLLRTIPGIGHLTAVRLLAEIPDIRAFKSAKQLAAFIGLTPDVYESGASVKRRARLSKKGNATLRAQLYWPAIRAMKDNPVVAHMAQRHRQAGKPGLVIIVAAMHKLINLAYGVLKSNRPFDPAIPFRAASAS